MPNYTMSQRKRAAWKRSEARGKAAANPLGVTGEPASSFKATNRRGVGGPPRASELARDTSKSQVNLNRKMAQAAEDRAAFTRAGVSPTKKNGKRKKAK